MRFYLNLIRMKESTKACTNSQIPFFFLFFYTFLEKIKLLFYNKSLTKWDIHKQNLSWPIKSHKASMSQFT